MSDEELPPTAEELAEAEALARALEPGAPASAGAPKDVLAAAALLRRAHDGASTERRATEDRHVAGGVARALAALEARRPARPRRRWLALRALLVPAAAAAALLLIGRRSGAPDVPPVPAPPLALLEAQARAASGRADLAMLDREMRAYRETIYATLGAGAPTGAAP